MHVQTSDPYFFVAIISYLFLAIDLKKKTTLSKRMSQRPITLFHQLHTYIAFLIIVFKTNKQPTKLSKQSKITKLKPRTHYKPIHKSATMHNLQYCHLADKIRGRYLH